MERTRAEYQKDRETERQRDRERGISRTGRKKGRVLPSTAWARAEHLHHELRHVPDRHALAPLRLVARRRGAGGGGKKVVATKMKKEVNATMTLKEKALAMIKRGGVRLGMN